MASKGKGIAVDGYGSPGKRKRDENGEDGRNRKNPNVLQFFDTVADVDDGDDESESEIYYDEEFWEEEFGPEVNTNNSAGKGAPLPVFPKEEQLSEDELDKIMEERYKPGAGFVTFAEDRYNKGTGTMERNTIVPSAEDPTVWKVKCVAGRERNSSFCLMQKYIDLRSMGTSKLNIISAFALDHVKGFIFVEAEKQCDIYEACQGLCSIYASRSAPIPKDDVSHLLCVRTKSSEISVGTWARVKSGRYKGDLAQIFAVNDGRKKATVKLIPRIDLQALAQKFGGGARVKNNAIPAARLLSSSELEEFRPLIQIRKDRDTGKEFEVLDGMLLKDGYLYKKVPTDSLSLWGVLPTEEELLKFETPARNDELKDLEWLSKLYGDEKKPRPNRVINDKGGGKGEGASSSLENSVEVHDLVIHGRKGFGVIIGMEKDETYRVLKEGTKGSMVVTAKLRELKKAVLDKKFNAFDHNKKTISLNDTVRILEGPLENKQGVVKQIYRGTIFVHDENETENGGYFCSKAEMCEKVKPSGGSSFEKGGGSGFVGFEEDPPSSPKGVAMDINRSFSRDDNNSDEMFSVGQSLRIKVGPLKGYLCKVLAVRRSDVTVKLDSQHKILTVKSDLLSEVRAKTAAVSTSEDPNSAKPFDFGTGDGPGGWLDGAGTSADAGGWNTGVSSAGGGAWAASSSAAPGESGWGSANPANAGDVDMDKDAGGWGKKVEEAPSDDSSWGKKVPEADTEQVRGWGQSSNNAAAAPTNDGWGSGAAKTTNDDTWGDKGKNVVDSSTSGGWGNAAAAVKETTEPAWGKPADVATDTGGWGSSKKDDSAADTGGWGNPKKDDSAADTGGWGNPKKDNSAADTGGWGNPKKDDSAANAGGWGNPKKDDTAADTGGWGNPKKDDSAADAGGWGNPKKDDSAADTGGWGNPKKDDSAAEGESTWGKAVGGTESSSGGWGNSKKDEDTGGGGWGKGSSSTANTGGWGQPSGGDASGGGGSSWGKKDDGGGSSWGNSGGGGSSWGKPSGGGSTWGADDADQPSGGGGRGRGRGGGGGRGCFNCGEEGHMSRECPTGGRGGGRGGRGGNCYKCGEEGHMSRECPKGGGGGGSGNCFKCGEEGHMSRECPKGGGGGRNCYKCGEEGHISRDCPSGGGGGRGGGGGGRGRACFKCGDEGHMSRECPKGGGGGSGGGGGGGWSSSQAGGGGWSSGGDGGGWGSKPASDDGGGGGWSSGGGSGWGSKPEAGSDGGGGGWGSKAVAASDGDKEAGGGWGSKAKTSDDVLKLPDGEQGSLLGKPPSNTGWGNPAPSDGGGSSWGNPLPPPSDGGGSSWGKPASYSGGSSWGKPASDGGGSSW